MFRVLERGEELISFFEIATVKISIPFRSDKLERELVLFLKELSERWPEIVKDVRVAGRP